jgi:hypothetical protein
MSEDVTYRGKLVLIAAGEKEVEAKAKELFGNVEHLDTYLEKLLNGEDYLYVYDSQELYSIEKTQYESYGFMEMNRNEDGSISFFTQFYNGGTCLTEMLEEGIKEV